MEHTDATTDDGSTRSDPAREPVTAAESSTRDVLVVGGGVAGLTAALFTARAGLDTLVVNDGESILRRNAHLENVPGFPAGVNSRLFSDLLEAQATENGVDIETGKVTGIHRDDAFVADLESGTTRSATRVVAASWSDASYLDGLGVELRNAGSKQYIEDDGLGRTNVDGVYATGRLAERYHQAVVSAGHGAQVGITLVHDAEVPFYHDWVAPEGYFTDRGREVPPGCEEIDADERERRERQSMAAMTEYFSERHSSAQRTHPSLVEDERGRLDE
ncbi:MAG: FAD-dependent oxidoreductase [Halobacteriota archaeon]